MAARIRRLVHDEETRARIKIGLLIKRLTDHALNEPVLDNSQVNAIKILLAKTLPDLSAIEMSAPDGGPVKMEITWKS